MRKFTDAHLQGKIAILQNAIEQWARTKELWHDCGFQSYLKRVDGQPGDPAVVTILWFEGPLFTMFNGTYDDGSLEEFHDLLTNAGYEYELADHVSAYIYASDPELAAAFKEYFHWQWVCSLIIPDCADVYEELYSHFADRPDDLQKISWRDFETLLFRIFQNQGFQAELGPGRGDGGVDLRLLQRDPLGDILTLVQAKKYAPKRKIGIEAVSSLYGITKWEDAQRGVFVTTSEYLPGARRFADRVSNELELMTSKDVAEWCRTASAGIVADKSTLVSAAQLHRTIDGLDRNFDRRLLHAHTGYNISTNAFALVLKETKYAALLMKMPAITIDHDGFGQAGREIPSIDERIYSMLNAECVWRAKRREASDGVTYWDGRHHYSTWDHRPAYFNLAD